MYEKTRHLARVFLHHEELKFFFVIYETTRLDLVRNRKSVTFFKSDSSSTRPGVVFVCFLVPSVFVNMA